MRWLLALGLLLFSVACSDARDGANPNPICHPFAGNDCAYPWPSSYFMRADSSTRTGVRVALPTGVLPDSVDGVRYDVARLNELDGFSPAGTLLANLHARIDPSILPPPNDPASALTAAGTVQVFDADHHVRVPLFAEVDRNADNVSDQVLLIRPLVRLQPATHYIVVLRDLVDTTGHAVHNRPFESLRDGFAVTPSLVAEYARYRELFNRIEAADVPRGALTLAWDFVTASDEQTLGSAIAMRDEALAMWQSANLGYAVEPTDNADEHLALELRGTFDVPSFLVDDGDLATLQREPDGMPRLRGVQAFPLLIHVPRCALERASPVPVMVFGHGLFGSAAGEMNSGYQKQVIDDLCMVQVGTDWIGLSGTDGPNVATTVVPDFSKIPLVTDRLQQAQVNFTILARLARQKLKDDPRLRIGATGSDHALVDGKEVYYYGISQGGIEGGTLLGLSPDLDRGALNVGAGIYSFMITRSVDFALLKMLLDASYPRARDQQLLFAMSQSYWDRADPISFAPYSLKAPLNGPDGKPLSKRHILLQEATNDSQVPNLATRMVARTLGLPALDSPVDSVWGIDVMPGPLDSAYTQWNVDPMPPPPDGNVLAPTDNGAHGTIRKLPQLIEQLRRFFKPDGRVEATCDGVCNFPGFNP